MKKKVILIICFLGMVFMNCYHEVNNDVTIKIENNSSLDLHISFFPNTFTKDKGGTYKYNDVNVKKGESVSLMVQFRYKEKSFGDTGSIFIGPIFPDDIKKIIFSKMDTGELIREVLIGEVYFQNFKFHRYVIVITDELLKGE